MVDQQTSIPGDAVYKYSSERNGRKPSGRVNTATEFATRNVIWADRFYSLRNHIIHGATPPDAEFEFGFRSRSKQRHIDIALLFFILLVQRRIEKSFRKPMFTNEVVWEAWQDSSTQTQWEGFVYNSLSYQGRPPRVINRITRAMLRFS
jgi:hypothetical protein